MRGVDLGLFAFDYDLTWAALFMGADGTTYGRFGGRDAESPDKYLTLAGLKYAMRQALEAHRRPAKGPAPAPAPSRRPEDYTAAKRMKPNACIHCHQVYDFRREELQGAGRWTRDEVWVYPLPESVGLSVDPDQSNKVRAVKDGSAAAKTGLRPGDVLRSINKERVASFADVQYALHRAPAAGRADVAWERDGKALSATLQLAEGWRKSDISWRGSMWGLDPQASVYGQDLSPGEKKKLGLAGDALAFRQGNFVPGPAREAGVRGGDIVLGFAGKDLRMTMLQFNAYVRLNHKVGDQVTYTILRDGKRMDIPLKLSARKF